MDEPRWLTRSRRALDQSCRDIDAPTLSRLNRARQAALDAAAPGRRNPWIGAALTATAALAIAAAVGLWRQPAGLAPPAAEPVQALADLELLRADAELDLLADLEFFLWLDQELDGADAG